MDMYESSTLLPDSYEVLKELSRHYKIYICEGAETKLLFTAWHNRDLTDDELSEQNIIRVNNWKKIKDILLNN